MDRTAEDEHLSVEDALRALARDQAAVADLGRRALEGVDPADLMSEVVSTVAETLEVELTAILELLPGDGGLRMVEGRGWEEGSMGTVVPGGPASLAGYTLAQDGPILVEDFESEDRFTPAEVLRRQRVRSSVSVPIRGRERPFGVLAAHSLRPRRFGEDDVYYLRSTANVLAAAIQRSRAEDSMRRANALLHGVVEGSTDPVFAKDPDGRYVLANSAAARVLGHDPDDLVGRTAADVLPAEAAREVMRNDAEVLSSGRAQVFEEVLPVDGSPRTFLSTKSPYLGPDGRPAGLVGVARDITDRKRMEGHQRFLAESSAMLDASLDPAETLQNIASLAVPGVADVCVIDLAEDGGALTGVAVAASDPAIAEGLRDLRSRFPLDPDGRHPVARVLRSGRAQLFEQLEPIFGEIAQSEEHLAFARRMRYRSAIVAPLTARGETMGTISLIRLEGGLRYEEDELELVRDLGRRAAMALHNARLYEREHSVAETLQRSLLPEVFPEVPGLRFAARYLPGGAGVDVGGDWYDVIPLPGGLVGLAIGDVAGRGLRAASVMGQLRTTLRVWAVERVPPGEALERVDRVFQRIDEGELATLLYLTLDPYGGEVRYSSAAQPPALLIHPEGGAELLEEARSVPLGAVPDAHYGEARIEMPPGSTLLLYTDGLVERPGESIDAGLERLRLAAESGPDEPEELLDHVIEKALGGNDRPDDVAALAVRLMPVRETLDLSLPSVPDSLVRVRRELRPWLAAQGVEGAALDDINVACNELVANAVEHAYGLDDGRFQVRGARDGDRVLIRVRDWGRWREPQGSGRGRGLPLVELLMDTLDVQRTDDGTEVRMTRRLTGRASG